jgi:rSAM/selenodomain-associated transferase 1
MENAAGLYARLLYRYLLDLAYSPLEQTAIELSVASPEDIPFFADAFPEWSVQPQVDGNLGQRMAASFDRAFAQGARSVVLTGSDIPGLNSTLVRQAYEALETVDLVLGPAADGGYYLIGMHAPHRPLFEGIPWSSDRVLVETVGRAHAQGLQVAYLPELYDVDSPAEYRRWRGERVPSPRS